MAIRVTDSSYIDEKDVVICRSGIQAYTYEEMEAYGLDMTGHDKSAFNMYRPPSVVVDIQDMVRKLPVAKEHPPVDIDSSNFDQYCKGITGDEVEVVSLSDENIGIKVSLAFFTEDLYRYYKKGNKEVSLGYKVEVRWATESEKFKYGCDAILTKIISVNHLAITMAGRGGSDVSIIDSVIGGIKTMKTGFMHYLKNKGKLADTTTKLSDTLFSHLESSKGKTGEALGAEVKSVTDSIAHLKDCDGKTQLIGLIQDAFESPDVVLSNKAEAAKVIDSCYISVSGDSIREIAKALGVGHSEPDGDEGTTMADSKKGKKEEKGEEGETDDTDGKGKNTNNVSDSSIDVIVSKVTDSIMDKLSPLVEAKITAQMSSALGITPGKAPGVKDSMPSGGIVSVTDSATESSEVLNSVMDSFIN